MKKKLLHDISANSLQVIINQLCGLGIFYVLSAYLDKNNFGELNWSLAVLLTLYGILACGLEQVVVKKIASGEDEKSILSIYFSHVLLSGFLAYGLLLAGEFIFPAFFQKHNLLLLLGIGKGMIFFSTPFKQLATGMEKFRPLLFMSVCSNVLRSIALLLLAFFNQLNLGVVVIIFISGDLIELLLCLYITNRITKVPILIRWNKKAYTSLLKESLPQFGATVFSAVIARFDWIFLGLFASNIILADYSFAYKVFEMATLPMLVIAPILIPRFTKLFHSSAPVLSVAKTHGIFVLLRLELVIASLTALVLNILWIPVIDELTTGKYGSVNRYTILFLSASMPFLYLNNFLWNINFAKGKLKMIFYIISATFCINIVANISLIPFFKGEGAAIGFLMANIAQAILSLCHTHLEGLKKNSFGVLISPVCALGSGYLATLLFNSIWLLLPSAIIIFTFLLFLTRQLHLNDWPVFKRVMGL